MTPPAASAAAAWAGWPGVGDSGEESGFARVGITDQTHFGEDAQLKQKLALVTRLARLRKARRLMGRGSKVPVPETAAPSLA